MSTTTERLLKTSKKHNEQIRCACLICSTSLQSLLEPEIGCDGAVILLCVIARISSLWFSFNTYIYLLHKILSEHQQDPQYAGSGRRVQFCRQYKCFNLTSLHPHLGALCFRSFHGGGPCGAWHLVENFFYVPFFLRQHQHPRLWTFSVIEVGIDC